MSATSKTPRWLALAASLVLFLSLLAWALIGFDGGGPARTLGSSEKLEPIPLEELAQALQPVETAWNEPVAQGGENWLFDLFTPPVIYYDSITGTFTVTPPSSRSAPETSFPFHLTEVVIPEYRYQLIAYAGMKGDYLLTLDDRETGQDVFVAPAEYIPGTRVLVKSFSEERMVPEGLEAGTTEVFDLVGVCILQDETSGTVYRLESGKPCYLDTVRVSIAPDAGGEPMLLSTGDRFVVSDHTYCIGDIDVEIPSVAVRMLSDQGDVMREQTLQSESSAAASQDLILDPL